MELGLEPFALMHGGREAYLLCDEYNGIRYLHREKILLSTCFFHFFFV